MAKRNPNEPSLRERQATIRAALAKRAMAWRSARAALLAKIPEGLCWHVAVTMAGKERAAERGLIEAGFAAYCPLERVTIGRAMRRTDVERPLFARYVFFAVRAERRGRVASVREVQDVLSGAGGTWLVAPEAVIAALMKAEGLGTFDRSDAKREAERKARLGRLKVGARVQLTAGALEGHVGRIVALKPQQRASLLMTLFGTETRVDVNLDALAAVA